jgi:hypothetical protein
VLGVRNGRLHLINLLLLFLPFYLVYVPFD